MRALLVIDMQRWMFRTPERMAQVPGLVRAIEGAVRHFAERGWPVVEARTVHQADRSTWTRNMQRADYACLIEGAPDAEPVDGYVPPPGAIPITKTRNDAFLNTPLDERLRERGVTDVLIAGVFVDGCVGLTAASAAQRDYGVNLLEGGVGHVVADHGAAIEGWLERAYGTRRTTIDG